MEIVEKINYLLQEKKMQKKEFAKRLFALEPKLKSTGNTPNIQTIYGYLNGKRELKVELIPYIAEVLGVKEQELFSIDIEYASEYDLRYSKEVRNIVELLPYAPKPFREELLHILKNFKENSTKSIYKLTSNLSKPQSQS